jgi:hypothetical protein
MKNTMSLKANRLSYAGSLRIMGAEYSKARAPACQRLKKLHTRARVVAEGPC